MLRSWIQLIVLSAIGILQVQGASIVFTGNGNTASFHDPMNWNTRTIPTSSDQVTIGGTYKVFLDSPANVSLYCISIYIFISKCE